MNINQKVKYLTTKCEKDALIVDIIEKFGPSVKNGDIQTMDLVYTTYYVLKLEDGSLITVTRNFIEEEE